MSDAPTLDEWRVLALRLEWALAFAVGGRAPDRSNPMWEEFRAVLNDAKALRTRDLPRDDHDGDE